MRTEHEMFVEYLLQQIQFHTTTQRDTEKYFAMKAKAIELFPELDTTAL